MDASEEAIKRKFLQHSRDLYYPHGLTLDSASDSVEDETTFGISKDAGTSDNYSRADHTHGTPTDPIPAHERAYAHGNIPSEDEKDALAGTSGTPSASNPYVTAETMEAMGEPSGFLDSAETTISFNDGNRTLTVTKVGASFDVYCKGTKVTFSSNLTKQITTDVGLHFIYWNLSSVPSALNIQDSTDAWDIQETIQIATVYWDGSKGWLGDERHGLCMDMKTHEYLHETVGSRFASGMAGTFTDSTFSIEAGEWYDEDIEHTWLAPITTAPVFYRNGSAAAWTAAQAKYYIEDTNVLQYDNAGALDDVPNNSFLAMWCYAINSPTYRIVWVVGQRTDVTIASARTNNTPSALNLGALPAAEMKLLYRVILKRSGTSELYQEAQDYRSVTPLPTGNYVATDHGALAGLSDDDHPQYIMHPSPEEQGDVLYFDGSAWASLAHGTDGQCLVTKGHGANPEWSTVSGGSGLTHPQVLARGLGA